MVEAFGIYNRIWTFVGPWDWQAMAYRKGLRYLWQLSNKIRELPIMDFVLCV
jgi:hypothetical protein